MEEPGYPLLRLAELRPEKHEILVKCDAKTNGEVELWLRKKDDLPWEAETWYPVTVDIRKHGAKGKATWLDITRTRLPKRVKMDVASLFVHRQWKADDTVNLDGYDASGLSHVEWELIDKSGKSERKGRAKLGPLHPAGLGGSTGIGKWLYVYLDKAGNRSIPLRLPMP